MQLRSHETKVEKRKTERLLHEMLPKSVAYRLRKGEQVRRLPALLLLRLLSGFVQLANVFGDHSRLGC